MSNESCNTRIFLCRFLHYADVPSGRVQHADSSVAPGFRARSVARSGPSAGAQVASEDSVRCAERDVLLADTSVASSALRTKSFRPPFPTAFLPPLPQSPDKEVAEPRGQWQAEYPMFQNRPRLTLRMYLSMNSRYTNFCCASSLQGNRSAHVQPQLNSDRVRLAGRCRSELQAPPFDSVLTVCLINQHLDCRPVPNRQLQLVEVAAMLSLRSLRHLSSRSVGFRVHHGRYVHQ